MDAGDSEAKSNSGAGWPGYWAPVDKDVVITRDDNSLFTRRSDPPAALARPCTSQV
ncbi:MAG: peptide-methionine (R)-S-oxide reductase [Gammaproteobacteria bacterium]